MDGQDERDGAEVLAVLGCATSLAILPLMRRRGQAVTMSAAVRSAAVSDTRPAVKSPDMSADVMPTLHVSCPVMYSPGTSVSGWSARAASSDSKRSVGWSSPYTCGGHRGGVYKGHAGADVGVGADAGVGLGVGMGMGMGTGRVAWPRAHLPSVGVEVEVVGERRGDVRVHHVPLALWPVEVQRLPGWGGVGWGGMGSGSTAPWRPRGGHAAVTWRRAKGAQARRRVFKPAGAGRATGPCTPCTRRHGA